MESFSESTLVKWALGVVVAVISGIGIRGYSSKVGANKARDGADAARAEAEESFFATALGKKELEAEHWKDSSERAWKVVEEVRFELYEAQRLIDKIKSEARHAEANRKLRVKLFKAQHPDVDTSWFTDSSPTPLEGARFFDTDFGKLR